MNALIAIIPFISKTSLSASKKIAENPLSPRRRWVQKRNCDPAKRAASHRLRRKPGMKHLSTINTGGH
jgi:hypothetical protein